MLLKQLTGVMMIWRVVELHLKKWSRFIKTNNIVPKTSFHTFSLYGHVLVTKSSLIKEPHSLLPNIFSINELVITQCSLFQEEFKRLYTQLEVLKQKNMKLGNPHLTYKLSAMTEAAMKDEPSSCVPPPSPFLAAPSNQLLVNTATELAVPMSPNANGKRVIINLDDYKDATSLW